MQAAPGTPAAQPAAAGDAGCGAGAAAAAAATGAPVPEGAAGSTPPHAASRIVHQSTRTGPS
jgi:hypothetical protein